MKILVYWNWKSRLVLCVILSVFAVFVDFLNFWESSASLYLVMFIVLFITLSFSSFSLVRIKKRKIEEMRMKYPASYCSNFFIKFTLFIFLRTSLNPTPGPQRLFKWTRNDKDVHMYLSHSLSTVFCLILTYLILKILISLRAKNL